MSPKLRPMVFVQGYFFWGPMKQGSYNSGFILGLIKFAFSTAMFRSKDSADNLLFSCSDQSRVLHVCKCYIHRAIEYCMLRFSNSKSPGPRPYRAVGKRTYRGLHKTDAVTGSQKDIVAGSAGSFEALSSQAPIPIGLVPES